MGLQGQGMMPAAPSSAHQGDKFPGLGGPGSSGGNELRRAHGGLAGSPRSCSAEGADLELCGPLSSQSSCLPRAAQAALGDAGGLGPTWHLFWPHTGERGLEVRGHGHRPSLLMDLRLCLCLRHRRHVSPAPLPELRHQLPAAARPGHPHLQIMPGWSPALPAGPRDSEGP